MWVGRTPVQGSGLTIDRTGVNTRIHPLASTILGLLLMASSLQARDARSEIEGYMANSGELQVGLLLIPRHCCSDVPLAVLTPLIDVKVLTFTLESR